MARNLSSRYYFDRKHLNLKKNHTKSEQISICSHKISILDNSSKKTKFNKIFLSLNSTLASFFLIPVTFLCDEYIDRPKLTAQKKTPFEYIVPPPHKWGRNNYVDYFAFNEITVVWHQARRRFLPFEAKHEMDYCSDPSWGGRNYKLKWFFCSVNFDRSIYWYWRDIEILKAIFIVFFKNSGKIFQK